MPIVSARAEIRRCDGGGPGIAGGGPGDSGEPGDGGGAGGVGGRGGRGAEDIDGHDATSSPRARGRYAPGRPAPGDSRVGSAREGVTLQPSPGPGRTAAIDTSGHPPRREYRSGDLLLTVAADSQVGLRYPANFDVLSIDPHRPIVVVADGMGDGEGSAVAGRTAVATFAEVVTAADRVTPALLRTAVARAQRLVRAAGARLHELTGCTLTALVAEDGQAWIAHLGDSRVYRLRDGLTELLTVDHTAAWLGAIYGWYAADSPAAHAARYRLHRYVGHPDEPEPDVHNLALRPGDVLAVCTDGLAEQVPYDRLNDVLGAGMDEAEAVATLLADALAAGGRDNATLAVVGVRTTT
jgi:serine/threonine protein phosphatase PrpC